MQTQAERLQGKRDRVLQWTKFAALVLIMLSPAGMVFFFCVSLRYMEAMVEPSGSRVPRFLHPAAGCVQWFTYLCILSVTTLPQNRPPLGGF